MARPWHDPCDGVTEGLQRSGPSSSGDFSETEENFVANIILGLSGGD